MNQTGELPAKELFEGSRCLTKEEATAIAKMMDRRSEIEEKIFD